MFLFSSLSADVCLSVQVYRWITLRKHWAFALNRQHRYSQLIFSLSEAAPANHTVYVRATGNAAHHSFVMAGLHCAYVRVHAHITMGLNYVWPSLISYYLSHVFGRWLQPFSINLHVYCCCWTGFKLEEAPHILGCDYTGQGCAGKQCFESLKKLFLDVNVGNLRNGMFSLLLLQITLNFHVLYSSCSEVMRKKYTETLIFDLHAACCVSVQRSKPSCTH